jgi:hypothetical protein
MVKFILLIPLLFVGCASRPMTHGIPNFAVVELGIYRGGQPTAEGWSWLQANGVKFDVKLNSGSDGVSGMEEYDFPITLWQQLVSGPRWNDVTGAWDTLGRGDPLEWGTTNAIFIHCTHGQDRTGLVVAEYRLSEGWSKADAEKEMLAHGFHKSLRGLWRYWERGD